MDTTHLMVTTTPGLEDVVAAELAERAVAAGLGSDAIAWPDAVVAGRVRADVPLPEAETRALARSMRTIHHALRHVDTFALPVRDGLACIADHMRALAWPELDATTPFRVTTSRHGTHDFSSHDMAVTAGAVLKEITGAPVDLEHYAVHVQVDVVHDRCVIGVRWTERPLGLRFERVFNRRVALKAPVAAAMFRLAVGDTAPANVLDPFCGTGTILLEAGVTFPAAALYGSDSSETCVHGAADNLAANGLDARADLRHLDARELAAHHAPGSIDLIATNPPYGRKLGRRVNFVRFYQALLGEAAKVLRPDGRMVLLAGKRGALRTALGHVGGWRIEHARVIDMNQVHAGLFVLARA